MNNPTLKEQWIAAHRRELEYRSMAVLMEALFAKRLDYSACLNKYQDETMSCRAEHQYVTEPSVEFLSFVITRNGANWQVETSGDKTFILRFSVLEERVKDLTLIMTYCKRKEILAILQEIVLHLLCTYEANGDRKVFKEEE